MIKKQATWSYVFDALIVIADVLLGKLISPWFNTVFNDESAVVSKQTGQMICGVYLLLTAMYVTGLLLNRGNFRAEKTIQLTGGDNIALAFNVVLLASIFPLLIVELLPATMNMVVVIILTFGFMGGWGWLHWYILKKESSKNEGTPSLKRKIVGFFLVFPFVIGLALPVNTLVSEMYWRVPGEEINWTNAVTMPLFTGLLMALMAWFMFYIPRKMLKGFMGVNLRSRFFFWALVLDYSLKLSSLNLI